MHDSCPFALCMRSKLKIQKHKVFFSICTTTAMHILTLMTCKDSSIISSSKRDIYHETNEHDKKDFKAQFRSVLIARTISALDVDCKAKALEISTSGPELDALYMAQSGAAMQGLRMICLSGHFAKRTEISRFC